MSSLTIRLPDDKHGRLKALARPRRLTGGLTSELTMQEKKQELVFPAFR
jgi:predicted transcriptional regulator